MFSFAQVKLRCLPSLNLGCGACGLPSGDRPRSLPGLLSNAYRGVGPPRRTDVMHLPLDHPECCIHSSSRRGATLGHLEALPSEQELNADGITPSLLYKGNTRLTDVVIWRIEVLQS